jgi:hypothetical protein
MPSGSGAAREVLDGASVRGADFEGLLASTIAQGSVGERVARTFDAVNASFPDQRMDQIARQIAEVQPDLVALQEVTLWRTQSPGDGTSTAAADVAWDYLALLVEGLARRGLSYTVEVDVEAVHTDVEVTGSFGGGTMDVRFTDRDVMLVRA